MMRNTIWNTISYEVEWLEKYGDDKEAYCSDYPKYNDDPNKMGDYSNMKDIVIRHLVADLIALKPKECHLCGRSDKGDEEE